jgi:hypothetical protein
LWVINGFTCCGVKLYLRYFISSQHQKAWRRDCETQTLAAAFALRIGFDGDPRCSPFTLLPDFLAGNMGDLRNKARKDAQKAAIDDAQRRRSEGWTVFHFDFNPKLIRRNLTMGEAIRALMSVTGTRISFWRCPVRGLAIQYRVLPMTSYIYDSGETYKVLHFSDHADEVEAKKVLVLDMLLRGIQLYRALPNKRFDAEVERICWLLKAPPSVPAEEWRAARAGLDVRSQEVLRTHEAELRFHLLGEKYAGATGPVAMTVRIRLESMGVGQKAF